MSCFCSSGYGRFKMVGTGVLPVPIYLIVLELPTAAGNQGESNKAKKDCSAWLWNSSDGKLCQADSTSVTTVGENLDANILASETHQAARLVTLVSTG